MGARGALPAIKKSARSDVKTITRPVELPEAAVAIWDELAKRLAIAGRLQPEDFIALEKLSRAFALYRSIQLEIETGTMTITQSNGITGLNHGYKALVIIGAEIERGIRHFGLSPATRGALSASNPDSEIEEFDDYLARRPVSEAKD